MARRVKCGIENKIFLNYLQILYYKIYMPIKNFLKDNCRISDLKNFIPIKSPN